MNFEQRAAAASRTSASTAGSVLPRRARAISEAISAISGSANPAVVTAAVPTRSPLVTNGFSMSGTLGPAKRYMRYFAYWPMLVHQRLGCRQDAFAFVIDSGCGGALYTIDTARKMIEGGTYPTIAVVTSNFTSAFVDPRSSRAT